MRTPVPLRPDYSAVRNSTLLRAIAAKALAISNRATITEVVRRRWPDEQKTLEFIVKNATAPASTAAGNWAAQFATTANADVLAQLAPQSAGAQVLRACISLEFGGTNTIVIPTILASGDDASFVGQGAPLPVRQFAFDGTPTLSPHKIGLITTFTAEITKYSTPSIEALLRLVLAESVAAQVDAVLFGTGAGDTDTPKGLLNGISATTASVNADRLQAMREDIGALAGAVSAVAGGAPILIVASPTQAIALRLWGGSSPTFPVYASSALSAGTVIALASNCVASAVDPSVRFDVSENATLHMEADTPLQIGTTGTPNTVAAPTRSLWQTNSLALRLIFECDWCLRHASGAAYVTGANW